MWSRGVRRALRLAALVVAAAVAPSVAQDFDCSRADCIDVERLPGAGSSDLGAITRRAQRFFGVDAKVYIVSSEQMKAALPYMLPRQIPEVLADQIHIPELYHAATELKHAGLEHYVWHYIIGHEMAHVSQERGAAIRTFQAFCDASVLIELHADFLAGFFIASEYHLTQGAIDSLLSETSELPSGRPDAPDYHGEPRERFFVATQGAVLALQRPRPTVGDASAQGFNLVYDLVLARYPGALAPPMAPDCPAR